MGAQKRYTKAKTKKTQSKQKQKIKLENIFNKSRVWMTGSRKGQM